MCTRTVSDTSSTAIMRESYNAAEPKQESQRSPRKNSKRAASLELQASSYTQREFTNGLYSIGKGSVLRSQIVLEVLGANCVSVRMQWGPDSPPGTGLLCHGPLPQFC